MGWEPPSTFEEKLKHALVPAGLYIRQRARRELRKGERELQLLPFLAPAGKVALDIGANKGVYSYYLARFARQVHAFEPNPKHVRLLRRGLARNVTVHGYALGDANRTDTLKVPKGPKGYSNQRASFASGQIGDDYGEVEVEIKRLDDLGITDIGFMKIDVEGFERETIAGARDTIVRDKPNLVIEIEAIHAGVPAADIVAEVMALGYGCVCFKGGVLTPFEQLDPAVNFDPFDRPNYVFNYIFLPK